MSRKGNCYDNCIMETFFGRLKTEIYYDHESEYKSFEVFSVAVKEYIYDYNNKRMDAACDLQTSIHIIISIRYVSRNLGTHHRVTSLWPVRFI